VKKSKAPAPKKSTGADAPSGKAAEAQVQSFIEKFDAANQKLIRDARAIMRKRFPTTNELVYDNYNFFVLAYSPTDRPSDSILSLAAAANGLILCFLYGISLPDPKKLLRGAGNQVRSIRVPSVDVFRRAEVKALIDAAEAQARAPFAKSGQVTLTVRSVSAKQRPRQRPA